MNLYPLKFEPIYKKKIWGGNKLGLLLNKDKNISNLGESWEISAVESSISIISNGFLEGNDLQETLEMYMGELVGDKIFDKFGIEFPLLIKFIDAQEDLSIQVHPNDEQAKERHKAYGKTELWYVLDAEENAKLISGFSGNIDKSEYLKSLNNNKLFNILNYEKVKAGDVLFIPPGRIHTIGKGIVLAEIQQTSDITYRIYDYNRTDKEGNARDLHTDLALDVLDFQKYDKYKTDYTPSLNKTKELEKCQYFTVNILEFDAIIEKDYQLLDSFIIYICVEGEIEIETDENKTSLIKGETVLIPASITQLKLHPKGKAKVLEVYI